MATGRFGAVIRDLDTLFALGAVGSLSDAELLTRFLERRDGADAAFEALVARHGPMVLGVCRRYLRDMNDAEDAFQAVFVLLVRRAEAIRNRDALGPWLHGVARRMALRARGAADRRRELDAEPTMPVGAGTSSDLRDALHDAIARLPEKYRVPVVLCELEGRTHAEAAATLRCPIGTVSGRLSRARDLLRNRLVRQGLPASVILGMLAAGEARASVGPRLVPATVAAARLTKPRGVYGLMSLAGTAHWKSAAALAVLGGGLTFSTPAADAPSVERASRVVHAEAGRPTTEDRLRIDARVTALAVAPDGKTMASGRRDATVTLWDIPSGRELHTLLGHQGAVVSLAFSGDGRSLASAAEDRTVKLWDVGSGRQRLSLSWRPSEASPPIALDFGPNGPDRTGSGRDRRANDPGRPACS